MGGFKSAIRNPQFQLSLVILRVCN